MWLAGLLNQAEDLQSSGLIIWQAGQSMVTCTVPQSGDCSSSAQAGQTYALI